MKAKILSYLLIIVSASFLYSCGEIEFIVPDDIVIYPPPPPEEAIIKVAILRSAGSNYPSFWRYLNEEWEAYGNVKVEIDYESFDRQNITYEELVASGADVVVLADARNPLAGEDYSAEEIQQIIDYVQEDHALIVTGGTLRPQQHWQLVRFLGFKPHAAGQVYFGEPTADSIVITRPDHAAFNKMEEYTTHSRSFYSGDDWNRDGKNGYPEDWQYVMESEDVNILGYIWNTNHLSNSLECSPITYFRNTNYKAVFAGHNPAGPYPSIDDYQFYYNILKKCGTEG